MHLLCNLENSRIHYSLLLQRYIEAAPFWKRLELKRYK